MTRKLFNNITIDHSDTRPARIDFLKRNLILTVPISIICITFLYTILYFSTNLKYLTAWFLYDIVLDTASFFIFSAYYQQKISVDNFYRLYISNTAAHATVWAIASIFFLSQLTLDNQMILLMFIIGFSACSTALTHQACAPAGIIYSAITLLPTVAVLSQINTPFHHTLAIALIFYFVFTCLFAYRGYKAVDEIIHLRFDKEELIHNLSEKNHVIENANNQLNRTNVFLLESETRFRLAFENAAIGMGIVSLEGGFMRVNAALCNITGYSEEELLKLTYQMITYPEDLQADLDYVNSLISGNVKDYQLEKRYIQKGGQLIWVQISVSLVRDTENHPLYFIAQVQNIDATKQAEAALRELAYKDTLTGLANRQDLEIRFSRLLDQQSMRIKRIAICFMDLDNFKQINDTYGHDVGDIILKEIASRLKNCITIADYAVRLGGDEFILLLVDINYHRNLHEFVNTILRALAQPIMIDNLTISVSASAGISFFPENGRDLKTLLKNADIALYRAKHYSKKNSEFSIFEA